MKKRWIFLIIVILSLLVFGKYYFNEQKKVGVVDFSSLCAEKESGDCPAGLIKSCLDSDKNIVYQVIFGCTDVPSKYYYSNLSFAASCGGMPLPSGGSYKSSGLCDKITNCSVIKSC